MSSALIITAALSSHLTCWTCILSHTCKHPYASLLIVLMFHKCFKMFPDKARSSLLQNHEQLLSKSALQKCLKEIGRTNDLLCSKTVLPSYTCTCEYLDVNTDKMYSFTQGNMHTFTSLHSADSTGDASRSRWHFLELGIALQKRQVQSGETQPSAGLWFHWFFEQLCLLMSWKSVFQHLGPTHFIRGLTYVHGL